MSYRSFGITLRTKVGINNSHIKEFERWLKKQPYYAYVFEKEEEERHIHAQIWLTEPRTRGNIKKPLDRHIINNYAKDEFVLRFASNVRIAYNNEFLDEYLQKENSFELYNPPPDEEIYDYYPTEEEQEAVQQRAKSKNGWLLELEALWKIHATDHQKALPNIFNVASFLEKIAELDLWRICKDCKQRQQECQIFTWWLLKNTRGDLYLTKEQQEARNLSQKWKMENGKENQD